MCRLTTLLTHALLATLFLAPPGVAQGNPERLNGRWDVTIEIPDRRYRTVIEFNILSDGSVDATTLGALRPWPSNSQSSVPSSST